MIIGNEKQRQLLLSSHLQTFQETTLLPLTLSVILVLCLIRTLNFLNMSLLFAVHVFVTFGIFLGFVIILLRLLQLSWQMHWSAVVSTTATLQPSGLRSQKTSSCPKHLMSFVTRTSRFVSITPARKKLHWLPIEYRIQFKVNLLTFKALHFLSPTYLKAYIEPYTSKKYKTVCPLCLLAQSFTWMFKK